MDMKIGKSFIINMMLDCERLIDEGNDSAKEFGEGASDTVLSIFSQYEKTGSISEKQMSALINIRRGVDKWIERMD